MSDFNQRPFFIALLVSLLIHLLILESPGWRVPDGESLSLHGAGMENRLNARLGTLSGGLSFAAPSGFAQILPAPAPRKPPQAKKHTPSSHQTTKRTDSKGLEHSVNTTDAQVRVAASSSGVATPEGLEGPGAGAEGFEAMSAAQAHATQMKGEKPAEANGEKGEKGEEGENGAEVQHAASILFSLPPRGRVHYQVMRGERGLVVGQSVHHWNHNGKNYVLNSVTETTGLIALFKPVRVVWVSQGAVGPEGLRPHDFRSEKEGGRADSARFDWANMTLDLSGGGQRTVRLLPGSQDVLSMFYQLGSMLPGLLQQDDTVAKEGFSLPVTTGRKLEEYRFQWLGETSLDLPRLGVQRTVHLRVSAGEQTIDLWLGESLRALPLKIRYTDGKGDSFDQLADQIEFEDTKGKGP